MSSSSSNNNNNNSTITLHLTVTAEQGAPRVPLECPKTATCTELRTLAAQATHIPLASLKLIFRGRLIANANDKTAVEEFKLEHGSVLHCMGKPEKPTTTTTSTAATSATANNNNDSSNNNNTTPVAAVPALASSATTTTSSSSTPTSSLKSALQHLQQSNSLAMYTTAITTLQKMLQNIIDHPLDEKYRKVKKHNAAFAKRLGGVQGGDAVMRAAGFVVVTDQEVESYVLQADPQAWTQLLQHKEQVDRAVTNAQAAATMTAPPTASASLGGGFPSMPTGGVSPMQQQMAAQMMSDPQALQTMLQNPMVQQMVRNDPRFAQMAPMMQELANNPAMAQQLSQMMQNPQLQQQMQQVMAQQQQQGNAPSAFPNFMPPEAAPTNNSNNAAAFPNFMPPGTQNNNTNNAGQAAPSDDQLTEEEMIAEAIRRSLQDDNNNNNNNNNS